MQSTHIDGNIGVPLGGGAIVAAAVAPAHASESLQEGPTRGRRSAVGRLAGRQVFSGHLFPESLLVAQGGLHPWRVGNSGGSSSRGGMVCVLSKGSGSSV